MLAHIKDYLLKTRWMILFLALVTFLTHGSTLFSQRFGIDTDIIMQGMHHFNQTGRQGLVWLAGLLGFEWFNLYYVQALNLLFLTAAPVAFGYLFYRVGAQSTCLNVSLLVLGLSFIVSPFWAAQIYFLNQSAQVLLACTLTAVSILLAEEARREPGRKWYCLLLAIALMQITFACYQVLVMVYIAAVAAVFLMSSLKEERSFQDQLRWIGFHAGAFLVGFLLYMLTYRLFFAQLGGYLEGQITWADSGLWQGIKYCYYAIRDSLMVNAPYFTGFYGIFALLLLAVTVHKMKADGAQKKLSSLVILLAELFLIGSPYVFVLLQGGQIMDRMQLVMPLSLGSILYLTVLLLYRETAPRTRLLQMLAKVGTLALILAIGKNTLSNLDYCTRLYYTADWAFKYDTQIAEKIYLDIQAAQSVHEKNAAYDNIIFVGNPEIPYNDICIRGEMLGLSVFQFEKSLNNPGANRLLYFMENLGYPLDIYFSEGETAAYHAYFVEAFGQKIDEMPSYPAAGYAQYVADEELGLEYLIVKLGEEWRFE